MRFSEIASRLNGISVPGFGLQWSPAEPDVAVVRRVIARLEDHRVLFAPLEFERERYAARSVLELRRFLTDEIGKGPDEVIAAHLRQMRAACHKFLSDIEQLDQLRRYSQEWKLADAFGQLRATFGLHVALLAAGWHVDVEEPLASILPAADSASD